MVAAAAGLAAPRSWPPSSPAPTWRTSGGNAEDASDAVGFLLRPAVPPRRRPRARLERIAALPFAARAGGGGALAAGLDRDAVYIGFANGATPELVSKRLGCVVRQPEYPGVDLAALCVRGGAR